MGRLGQADYHLVEATTLLIDRAKKQYQMSDRTLVTPLHLDEQKASRISIRFP